MSSKSKNKSQNKKVEEEKIKSTHCPFETPEKNINIINSRKRKEELAATPVKSYITQKDLITTGSKYNKTNTSKKLKVQEDEHEKEIENKNEIRVRTEYAKNRPQRSLVVNKANDHSYTAPTESLELVPCLEYEGDPKSSKKAQPFSIEIKSHVLFCMDCHAHLSTCEIIGLLGGEWDDVNQHLTVHEAFPCKRVKGSECLTSVEMDPESEVVFREEMEEKGYIGVGWYHSHPEFPSIPSKKDMENQKNYQKLFHDNKSKLEPFIGFIVSPYYLDLTNPESLITAFNITTSMTGSISPYKIKFDVKEDDGVMVSDDILKKLSSLVEIFIEDRTIQKMNKMWRGYSEIDNRRGRVGPPLTKLQKMLKSLLKYFTDENCRKQIKTFVKSLFAHIY